MAGAGDFRSDHRHMRRGQQRIFPARHITADRIDRDILVPEHDARQSLHFDIFHRIALVLGEIAHLLLRKLDVVDVSLGKLRDTVLDFSVGQPVVLAVPLVECRRQFTNRVIAALLDVGENSFHSRANLRIIFGALGGVAATLEVFGHQSSPCYLIA
jgi:hypothetical protein